MTRVALFSLLLVTGLVLSQVVPGLAPTRQAGLPLAVKLLTMTALAFIMIRVGEEFDVDKGRLRSYGWDYVVAMTAATFPWLLVSGYFLLVMQPMSAAGSSTSWREVLLAGRFAAPTSAGLLFTMLAAAGLSATWVFRKARVLAIFDDLDTVLLMIPLKMLIIGLAWQMGATFVIMATQLWFAWRWLHRLALPNAWPWVLGYAVLLVAVCEGIYLGSKLIDDTVPIYVEVLLPAFVLGCMIRHEHGARPSPGDKTATSLVSACFMVLVGLNVPPLFDADAALAPESSTSETPGWGVMALHVLAVTALANIGKLFPLACYRRDASPSERLALSIAMWPRGEVGAGVLVISLGYGIGGPMITVTALSLALNLLLTGPFILLVRRLLASGRPDHDAASRAPVHGSLIGHVTRRRSLS